MGPAMPYASCHALAMTAGVDGVGVSLCGRPMYSSDEATARLEDLQFVLGEGPAVAAFELRTAVERPHTASAGRHPWLHLDLDAACVGAAFAFPMLVADACLGAVTLYRRAPGRLTDSQRALAAMSADAAALETAALLVDARVREDPVPALRRIDELQQAVGVVMAQLNIDDVDAMARLRAHAFHADRPLADVIADLRAGRLDLGRQ
jgi:GAF domain-containing protein